MPDNSLVGPVHESQPVARCSPTETSMRFEPLSRLFACSRQVARKRDANGRKIDRDKTPAGR
jgi:hypothetical protein